MTLSSKVSGLKFMQRAAAGTSGDSSATGQSTRSNTQRQRETASASSAKPSSEEWTIRDASEPQDKSSGTAGSSENVSADPNWRSWANDSGPMGLRRDFGKSRRTAASGPQDTTEEEQEEHRVHRTSSSPRTDPTSSHTAKHKRPRKDGPSVPTSKKSKPHK